MQVEIITPVILLIAMGCGMAKLAVAMAKEDIRRETESENAWQAWERENGHYYYY